MDTIAIDPGVGPTILRNATPYRSPGAFADGLWCVSTLSPDIHIRVGWDGLINRAYDHGDEEPSGHWIAES